MLNCLKPAGNETVLPSSITQTQQAAKDREKGGGGDFFENVFGH